MKWLVMMGLLFLDLRQLLVRQENSLNYLHVNQVTITPIWDIAVLIFLANDRAVNIEIVAHLAIKKLELQNVLDNCLLKRIIYSIF